MSKLDDPKFQVQPNPPQTSTKADKLNIQNVQNIEQLAVNPEVEYQIETTTVEFESKSNEEHSRSGKRQNEESSNSEHFEEIYIKAEGDNLMEESIEYAEYENVESIEETTLEEVTEPMEENFEQIIDDVQSDDHGVIIRIEQYTEDMNDEENIEEVNYEEDETYKNEAHIVAYGCSECEETFCKQNDLKIHFMADHTENDSTER